MGRQTVIKFSFKYATFEALFTRRDLMILMSYAVKLMSNYTRIALGLNVGNSAPSGMLAKQSFANI